MSRHTGEYAVAVKVHVSRATALAIHDIAKQEDRSVNWLIRKWIGDALEQAGHPHARREPHP